MLGKALGGDRQQLRVGNGPANAVVDQYHRVVVVSPAVSSQGASELSREQVRAHNVR